MNGFKPNIYPVMYWALAYGVAAGVLLFVVYLLSQFITLIWFPVFLVGLAFGAFRNYQNQRRAFEQNQGIPTQAKPVMQEFREAVVDIANASQEMVAQQQAEDAAAAQQQAAEFEQTAQEEQNIPPAPPTPPTPPSPQQ